MDAEPRELRLDSALVLTIQITYKGEPGEAPIRAPRAPRLPQAFNDAFAVSAFTEESAGNTWRYTCKLFPKSSRVDHIPALLFTYHSPQLGYRTLEIPAIDIKVLPRDEVGQDELDNVQELPAATGPVYRFATGPELLEKRDGWDLPGPGLIALVFLLPPLLCLGYYQLWRQLYPDEALRLRRRRSRAARQALRGLELARVARSDVRGSMAAAIMTNYLKERLDLPMLEPTPREAAQHLLQVGCSEATVAHATDFFALCDTARFAADPGRSREHVIDTGTDLIQSLEKEACRA
jgi:hypothetical protein